MNNKSLVFTLVFGLLPAAAACSGATTAPPATDDDAVATSDALKRVGATCDPSACPGPVPALAQRCDDGSTSEWKCLKTKSGCGLKLVCPGPTEPAPPPSSGDGSTPTDPGNPTTPIIGSPGSPPSDPSSPGGGTTCTCSGPVPALARLCPDGSTAPWVCLPDAKNVCNWVTACGI